MLHCVLGVYSLHYSASLLDNTPPPYIPPPSSSKSKGPNISQPIYTTSPNGIPFTQQFKTMPHAIPVESVYSLQGNVDYQPRQELRRGSADVPAGVPLSDAVSSKGLGSNRASAVSGGSGGDVGGNRLSATAFFTPRPGDNQGYLGIAIGAQTLSPGHKPVVKARSATSAVESLPDTSGLENRSHTNAVTYSTTHRSPFVGAEVISNGYMKPSSIDRSATMHAPLPSPGDTFNHYSHLQDSSPSGLPSDHETGVQNSKYDVPPPIDRSNKPLQAPPAVDRTLKPGRRETESSDSSKESSPEHQLSTPPPSSNTKLPAGSSSTDEMTKEDSESQFNPSDIPQLTVRSTHYTQVDFNPDTRRPVPLPRKTSNCSGGGTPTSVVPRTRRVNYSDVDIHATNQLAEQLNRQMTVREAERKALAEKQYVNIDHSGTVDDETDPDYYTHMRVCY